MRAVVGPKPRRAAARGLEWARGALRAPQPPSPTTPGGSAAALAREAVPPPAGNRRGRLPPGSRRQRSQRSAQHPSGSPAATRAATLREPCRECGASRREPRREPFDGGGGGAAAGGALVARVASRRELRPVRLRRGASGVPVLIIARGGDTHRVNQSRLSRSMFGVLGGVVGAGVIFAPGQLRRRSSRGRRPPSRPATACGRRGLPEMVEGVALELE